MKIQAKQFRSRMKLNGYGDSETPSKSKITLYFCSQMSTNLPSSSQMHNRQTYANESKKKRKKIKYKKKKMLLQFYVFVFIIQLLLFLLFELLDFFAISFVLSLSHFLSRLNAVLTSLSKLFQMNCCCWCWWWLHFFLMLLFVVRFVNWIHFLSCSTMCRLDVSMCTSFHIMSFNIYNAQLCTYTECFIPFSLHTTYKYFFSSFSVPFFPHSVCSQPDDCWAMAKYSILLFCMHIMRSIQWSECVRL